MKEVFEDAYRNGEGEFVLEDRKPTTLQIKKLDPNAVIPSYAYDGESVGLDLVATDCTYDEINDCYVYKTGLAINLQENEVGFVVPNSRNRKTNFYIPNSPGVVDPGYTGPITVNYKSRTNTIIYKVLDYFISNFSTAPYVSELVSKLFYTTLAPYEVGDVIAQLIICPIIRKRIEVVNELPPSKRGTGAHGSTDKK